MRRTAIPLALAIFSITSLFAGCVKGPTPLSGATTPATVNFSDLAAPNAKSVVANADGTKTFLFEGASTPGVTAILVAENPQDPSLKEKFDVDDRVGFVEANITYDGSSGTNVYAWLVDDQGRVQCGTGISVPHDCTAPVPTNQSSKTQWLVEVVDGYPTSAAPVSQPGIAYKVAVTLHPASHITRGDPLAGVDPSIRFFVSDTKARSSEPNVGVLGDGAIFAQYGLSTMMSKDDGKTWTNVAPATTSKVSLDPMLYADPYTSTVYVDQLYIGCSILAWTQDEGANWVTNPAACGLPADDHEKIASGPSPVPGSPLPAVYYAFSSFAQGIYVSHSYDGGASFVASPVTGVTDGETYDNTGHVFADQLGDVFDPIYLCNAGGSMGVGVSHDYGVTFTLVKVSAQKGPCADPDPGLSVDGKGNVYLSYWRPDGVYYAVSKDHGDTWSAPVKVSLPQMGSFVHVDSVAGDDGRLAIAYRATSDTAKGPDMADGWAAWYMYVAFVENATSTTPTIKTGMVDVKGDPDQRGQICTTGVACAGGSRNLLDFIDIAAGPDGRVYTVYADGCKVTCETPADSRAHIAPVGIEESGPRLFVDHAPWAKKTESSPIPTSTLPTPSG